MAFNTARAVACTAVSLPDTGDMFKTGTLSFNHGFMMRIWHPYQANKLTHVPGCSLTECFLIFDLNQPYWDDHAAEEVNASTHTFLGKRVSLLSGKCISSCQHFCSLLDWALCSAVTPLQEASSSPNGRAICPGSRLATSVPTHPCLSVCLPLGCGSCRWYGLEHVPGIRGGQALFVRM